MATDRRSPDRLDRGRNSRNFDCSAVLRFLLTPRSFGTPCGILPCCSIFCPVEQPNWEGANIRETCDASPSGQCLWRADFRVEVVHKIPRAQCAILPNGLTLPITRTPQIVMYLLTSVVFGLGQLPSTSSCSTAELDKVFMIWRSYVADADKSGAL